MDRRNFILGLFATPTALCLPKPVEMLALPSPKRIVLDANKFREMKFFVTLYHSPGEGNQNFEWKVERVSLTSNSPTEEADILHNLINKKEVTVPVDEEGYIKKIAQAT